VIEFHEQRVEQPHQPVPPVTIASRQCASDARRQQWREGRLRARGFGLGLALWLLIPAAAFAQTPSAATDQSEINTDRPDFTESSVVVGKGVIQLEGGFTSGSDHEDGVETNDIRFPQTLLRIGLSKRFELRLGADGLVTDSVRPDGQPAVRTSGFSAIAVGGKYVLRESDDGLALAIIPILAIPTGSDAFSGSVDPAVKFTWAHGLPHGFDVSGNVNFASVENNGHRDFLRVASVSFSHALAPTWEGYWELITAFDSAECACTFNTGVTRLFGRNFQLDAEAGWGLTDSATDWFVGFGFGVRFPKRSH